VSAGARNRKRASLRRSDWTRSCCSGARRCGVLIFAVLLGAALQITMPSAVRFWRLQHVIPESFGVRHPNLLLSISQSPRRLHPGLPFFLRRFGIKIVMLMSMFAWAVAVRPVRARRSGHGLWMLVLSMIVYGMAFDFFTYPVAVRGSRGGPNDPRKRQGLLMIMITASAHSSAAPPAGMVVITTRSTA